MFLLFYAFNMKFQIGQKYMNIEMSLNAKSITINFREKFLEDVPKCDVSFAPSETSFYPEIYAKYDIRYSHGRRNLGNPICRVFTATNISRNRNSPPKRSDSPREHVPQPADRKLVIGRIATSMLNLKGQGKTNLSCCTFGRNTLQRPAQLFQGCSCHHALIYPFMSVLQRSKNRSKNITHALTHTIMCGLYKYFY